MSREQCEVEGGDWVEPPGPEEPDSWGIMIKDVFRLGDLLDANVLDIAVDIRNEIMVMTTVGQRLLQIYSQHFAEAVRVIGRDQQLALQMLQAWAAINPFVTQLLAQQRGRPAADVRFDRQTHQFIAKLCDRVAAASRKESFRLAAAEVKTLSRRYVGLSPRDAIQVSIRPLSARSAGRAGSAQSATRPRKDSRTRTVQRKAKPSRR